MSQWLDYRRVEALRGLAAFFDAGIATAPTADARALQAPFRSGISIEDDHLDPVARALQMPRVNLLIADDAGLGKMIEYRIKRMGEGSNPIFSATP